MLERDGVPADARRYPVSLDLRYPGQAYEIAVPFEEAGGIAGSVAAFHEAHLRQFNHNEKHVTPEIVAVRVSAIGQLSSPAARSFSPGEEEGGVTTRDVVVAGARKEAPVFQRASLEPGVTLSGPLIVEEAHSTHFLPPGWRIKVHATGALVAEKEGGAL